MNSDFKKLALFKTGYPKRWDKIKMAFDAAIAGCKA